MFTGKLRPYQKEAFDRMIRQEGVLVAYDMGLGKTPITIATIEYLLEHEFVRGGLVITPAALKYQWLRQIEKFSDCATALVIDGTPTQRKQQYAQAGQYEYVIINYEQTLSDWDNIKELERDFIALDEATAIKNFDAKRSRRIKRLMWGDDRMEGATYRYALTGQPLENRPEEVFSILQAVDADLLGDHQWFEDMFIKRNEKGIVVGARQLPLLNEILSRVMVRKTRDDEDVRSQMPKVTEETIPIKFDPKTARVYNRIADDLLDAITNARRFGEFDVSTRYGAAMGDAEGMAAQGQVMTRLLALRQLCMHPEVLVRSAERYIKTQGDGTGVVAESAKKGSEYAADLYTDGVLDGLDSCPKLREAKFVISDILTEHERNKVVLFSFSKDVLQILSDELSWGNVQFTGDMNAKQKDAAKQKFQADPDCRVFLSSDAGGYGVDLPQANYLINYDLPFSSGKADQRNARIIRLSSEFDNVVVLNLLMKGSIEDRLYAVLESKRMLASAIVDGQGYDKNGELNLDLETLREFLEGRMT